MKPEPRARRVAAIVVATLAAAWCGLAVYFTGPASQGVLAALLGTAVAAAIVALAVRPSHRPIAAVLGLGVGAWFLFGVQARHDRDWLPEQARLPTVSWSAGVDRVTIAGVREFTYRSATDYDERWVTRSLDLDALVGIDVFVSEWGARDIAHTMVSWVFERAEPLVISIEARRERGEAYHPIPGLFRRYELYYVVADERDVVALRAEHRHERLHLYQLSTAPELAQELLHEYLGAVDRISRAAEFYDSLTRNCTTSTARHAAAIGVHTGWDWRLLANAHLDELLYEAGVTDTSMPFPELRTRSDITDAARATPAEAGDYSERLRAGLPPRPVAAAR